MSQYKIYKFLSRHQTPQGVFLMYDIDLNLSTEAINVLDFDEDHICSKITDVVPNWFFEGAVKAIDGNKEYIRADENLTWINTSKNVKVTITTTEKNCKIIYTRFE